MLYENLVVTSGKDAKLPFPLVCLYPKEGTAWADHPFVILDAPWVGAPERDAAKKLEAYLLSRPVQERAMTSFGFRPALTDIPLVRPSTRITARTRRSPRPFWPRPTSA